MRVNNPNTSASHEAQESGRSRRANQTEDSARAGQAAKADPSSIAARAEISPRAKEMAMAKQVASQAPDVREEKIAELKRRIASGEYNVKPEDVADKLVDEHIRSR